MNAQTTRVLSPISGGPFLFTTEQKVEARNSLFHRFPSGHQLEGLTSRGREHKRPPALCICAGPKVCQRGCFSAVCCSVSKLLVKRMPHRPEKTPKFCFVQLLDQHTQRYVKFKPTLRCSSKWKTVEKSKYWNSDASTEFSHLSEHGWQQWALPWPNLTNNGHQGTFLHKHVDTEKESPFSVTRRKGLLANAEEVQTTPRIRMVTLTMCPSWCHQHPTWKMHQWSEQHFHLQRALCSLGGVCWKIPK